MKIAVIGYVLMATFTSDNSTALVSDTVMDEPTCITAAQMIADRIEEQIGADGDIVVYHCGQVMGEDHTVEHGEIEK